MSEKKPTLITIYSMNYKKKGQYRPIGSNFTINTEIYESIIKIGEELSFTCKDTHELLYKLILSDKPTIIDDKTSTVDQFLFSTRLTYTNRKYKSIIIHSDGDTCKIYATITKKLWIMVGTFQDSQRDIFTSLMDNGTLDKSIIAFRDLHYYFAKGEYLDVKYKFKEVIKHLI